MVSFPEGFCDRALQAAVSALEAAAAGDAFDVNDLIVGAMALERIARSNEQAEHISELAGRLRRLIDGQSFGRRSCDRLEAGQLVASVRALRLRADDETAKPASKT